MGEDRWQSKKPITRSGKSCQTYYSSDNGHDDHCHFLSLALHGLHSRCNFFSDGIYSK